MALFDDFEREFGPPKDCDPPGENTIQNYEGKLPAEVIAMWREKGWCSWGDGLLWIVDPAQISDVLDEWTELAGTGSLVFLRTSFAHLYFWREGWVYSLDVHHRSFSQVTSDISLMFSLLCDPEIKEKILRASLHKEMVNRLGHIDRDECFAFEPALALGGSGAPDTIRRVKLREHLAILAQING